jgi:hypothetical protein
VKELVLLSQAENFIPHPGWDTIRILLDGVEDLFGNGIGKLTILLPDKGSTPGVSQETTSKIVGRLHQPVIILLFAVDILYCIIANFF